MVDEYRELFERLADTRGTRWRPRGNARPGSWPVLLELEVDRLVERTVGRDADGPYEKLTAMTALVRAERMLLPKPGTTLANPRTIRLRYAPPLDRWTGTPDWDADDRLYTVSIFPGPNDKEPREWAVRAQEGIEALAKYAFGPVVRREAELLKQVEAFLADTPEKTERSVRFDARPIHDRITGRPTGEHGFAATFIEFDKTEKSGCGMTLADALDAAIHDTTKRPDA